MKKAVNKGNDGSLLRFKHIDLFVGLIKGIYGRVHKNLYSELTIKNGGLIQ